MKNEDIIIDGRMGEGGGQVLRSSLSLAAALGRSVVIENVRGGRRKPGLLRQHRTALRAVRDITGGEIEGDELGATSVRFDSRVLHESTFTMSMPHCTKRATSCAS